MRLVIGRATDQGRVRDNNEDAFLVDADRTLFAVADGMGGHRGGEVASHTAIEALRAAFGNSTEIDQAIKRANDAVLARAAGDESVAGMGTTLTALTALDERRLVIGHVGDSRAYLLHGGSLRRVTDDHSLVEELVRDGRLTPEQAESHPRRAIVTRALGVDADVDVDIYPINVEAGDRVVLCSDGLTTMVRDRDIERVARSESDPQHAADALVAAANDAGGEDNITVLVIDVADVDPAVASPEPATAVAASLPPDATTQTSRRSRARASRPGRTRSRLRTVRGVIFVVVPLLAILGIAGGVLGWYARGSYFVGVSRNEVVIYKGVPGGVVGWDPTVDERTGLKVDQLAPLDRDRVQTNSTRGSLETVHGFVSRLRDAVAATSTTTRPRTTTTKPRTATTKPRTTTTKKKP